MKRKHTCITLLILALLKNTCVSAISEEKGYKGKCESLINYLEENDFSHFPNLQRYPSENYRIKYKKRKSHTIAFVMCRRLKTRSVSHSDRLAKHHWEAQKAKHEERGKFRCLEGNWSDEWPIPSCPDRNTKGDWSLDVFGVPTVTPRTIISEAVTEIVELTEATTRKTTTETTDESLTSEPTTSKPMTSEPTTSKPTTSEPTTSEPTTSKPTTSESTSSMVGQNRGTTGTLQGTNRRGNLRPKAENRIFRGNLA